MGKISLYIYICIMFPRFQRHPARLQAAVSPRRRGVQQTKHPEHEQNLAALLEEKAFPSGCQEWQTSQVLGDYDCCEIWGVTGSACSHRLGDGNNIRRQHEQLQ